MRTIENHLWGFVGMYKNVEKYLVILYIDILFYICYNSSVIKGSPSTIIILKERVDTMAKKFMVLDVEGMSTCKPYNIGYIVGDKNGNIYKEQSIAILPCIWENLKGCFHARDMTHKNVEEILNDIENDEKRKYIYTSIKETKRIILNDITEFNIKDIWAYNCPFDKASLRRLFKEDFPILDNMVNFYDIIPVIVYTKLLNKKYVKWCNKNGYITQKGNVMTKAEIVHKYLTGDSNFEEEHTGLADSYIEYNILLTAYRTRKKLNHNTTPAWKVFKDFCAVNEIELTIPPID